jgi:hypothetical protein
MPWTLRQIRGRWDGGNRERQDSRDQLHRFVRIERRVGQRMPYICSDWKLSFSVSLSRVSGNHERHGENPNLVDRALIESRSNHPHVARMRYYRLLLILLTAQISTRMAKMPAGM